LPQWERRLVDLGIQIESRVTWERGASDRDPDRGDPWELATPGIWACY